MFCGTCEVVKEVSPVLHFIKVVKQSKITIEITCTVLCEVVKGNNQCCMLGKRFCPLD